MRAAVAVTVEVLVWAALAFGIWVLTLSSATAGDLELAAPAAVLAGASAAMARRVVGGVVLRVPPGFSGWVWRLPIAAVGDTGTDLVFAVRSLRHRDRSGRVRTVQLPLTEDDRTAEARRAVGALMLAATPGSFTVDNDPDHRRMHVHELTPTRPSWAAIDPAATS